MTLERLERRRGETWQGLWLAPLATIVAQAFLLGVLADERIGWLARVAVLVAAVGSCLAAIWSVLRAHAREVQLGEAIAEWTAGSDGYHPDLRPAALSRPRRRRPATSAVPGSASPERAEPDLEAAAEEPPATKDATDAEAAPEAETEIAGETPASEGETEVLDPVPPPAARIPATAAGAPARVPAAGKSPTSAKSPGGASPTSAKSPEGASPPGAKSPPAPKAPPAPTSASRRNGSPDAEEREEWVARWDRHLVWWASGETHAKAYMAWTATLALFALADVAVLLSCV